MGSDCIVHVDVSVCVFTRICMYIYIHMECETCYLEIFF